MTITDPHLLMYVMEAREEVEGASEPQRLQALQRENADMEAKCIQVRCWVLGWGCGGGWGVCGWERMGGATVGMRGLVG